MRFQAYLRTDLHSDVRRWLPGGTAGTGGVHGVEQSQLRPQSGQHGRNVRVKTAHLGLGPDIGKREKEALTIQHSPLCSPIDGLC